MTQPSAIYIVLKTKTLDLVLNLVNVYGPYTNRKVFWDIMDDSGLLMNHVLILVSDLNFMLSLKEFWLAIPHQDPLRDYFINLFDKNNIVDINPVKLIPTWSNKRKGSEVVAKRLNSFLVIA